MTGKIVSIVNRKGGVGKTTLTLGLADTLVGEIERPYDPAKALLVVVDLDPQASLSRALLNGRDETLAKLEAMIKGGKNLSRALTDRLSRTARPVSEYVTLGVGLNGFAYAVLANDATAWDVERRALKSPGQAKLKATLKSILEELAKTYKYVVIDSPPGQTVLAEAAIEASDLVLCPTVPDLLSFWGLESFDAYLQELFDGADSRPPARFVFTKLRSRPRRADPQHRVFEAVSNFQYPERYVTLLREVGARSNLGGHPIALPHDARVADRLEGSPRPGRIWPWERAWSPAMRNELRRLASAVKQELESG